MRMYLAYGDDGGKFYIGPAGLEAYGPDILKPPHLVKLPPEPEPLSNDALRGMEEGDITEPLTEDELLGLSRVAKRTLDDPTTTTSRAADAWDTLRLIAEVVRLRAEWWKDHLMG